MNKQALTSIALICLSACTQNNDTAEQASNLTESAGHTTDTVANIEASAPTLSEDFPYTFESVTQDVWVIHGPREYPSPGNKGFMNNPGLVKTSAGLVLVDPGSTVQVGRFVLDEVKKISDEPIVAVFNTHVHGDHWLGNQAIREAYPDVQIHGHPNMIESISQGVGDYWVDLMMTMTEGASEGTEVVAPSDAADDGDEIKVGDTTFRIHHFGVAHSKSDIMIEAVEKSTVFLGDNVLNQRIARMTDGTFMGSIDSIDSIIETSASTYVPGHGPTGDEAMVMVYQNYLKLVYAAAQQAFEQDLDSSDVIDITTRSTTAYSDWAGYDEMLGPHGAQAYSEVELAEF